MSEDQSESPGCRTYLLPDGVIPEGHTVTAGGWVVPPPATRDDVLQAVQETVAELRQQLEGLRAQILAPPEPSPTNVLVGTGGARQAMLDVKACAATVGVSPRSWLRLVKRGEAPAPLKLGRLTRWRLSDVESFVASRC